MSAVLTLYVGNTQVVEVTGLRNSTTQAYMNAATVVCTLYAADSTTPLSGESWPKTLDYVAQSNGDYRAVLSHLIGVTAGSSYKYDITASQGGATARWQGTLKAVARPLVER